MRPATSATVRRRAAVGGERLDDGEAALQALDELALPRVVRVAPPGPGVATRLAGTAGGGAAGAAGASGQRGGAGGRGGGGGGGRNLTSVLRRHYS